MIELVLIVLLVILFLAELRYEDNENSNNSVDPFNNWTKEEKKNYIDYVKDEGLEEKHLPEMREKGKTCRVLGGTDMYYWMEDKDNVDAIEDLGYTSRGFNQRISKINIQPNQKRFDGMPHGGCLGCDYVSNFGQSRCLGCKYFNFNPKSNRPSLFVNSKNK